MWRGKRYNLEKYSILDIKEYLEKKGYKTEVIPEQKSRARKLHIVNTDVYFDYPEISSWKPFYSCLRFEDYPKTENYEKSKKLYESLKRKYALKWRDVAKFIKDEDKLFVRNWDEVRAKLKEEKENSEKSWEKEEKWWDEKWYKFW